MSDEEEHWETNEEKRFREKHGIHVPPPDKDYQPYSYQEWLKKHEVRAVLPSKEDEEKASKLLKIRGDVEKLHRKYLEAKITKSEKEKKIEEKYGKGTVALIGHPFRAKKVIRLKEKEGKE